MVAVQILRGREVPLGGLRALTVRRTLPHRDRSFVGAWCFVDHYGPTPVAPEQRGMDVPPHPHTGLQTVSWLFAGEIEHRDSGGARGIVRKGEVNLMTGGDGIAHSEVSRPGTSVLHGVQLWVALPDEHRRAARAFDHHVPAVVPLADAAGTARVFVGSLPGLDTSPVAIYTPLVGAELWLEPGASVELAVDSVFEHGILVDSGTLGWLGTTLGPGDLGCVDAGQSSLALRAGADAPVRAVLLGGAPFEEEIVMWWNFIGRSHDEIVDFRQAWQAGDERFGAVPGYVGEVTRVPAPELPNVRLRPRNRHGRLPA